MSELSRRQMMRAGSAALLGSSALFGSAALGLQTGRDDAGKPTNAKKCILVYLLGGPPHQDMWDMKPDALSDLRGPFEPIATSAPGVQICEHLPLLAKQAHRMSIVRSMSYNNGDHPFMTYYTLTGRISSTPLGANSIVPPSRKDDPHMGCVVSKFKHAAPEVPGYVAIPEVQVRMTQTPIAGGGRAGYLGPEYNPLAINGDPRKAGAAASLALPVGVTRERSQEREHLLAQLDGFGGRLDSLKGYQSIRRRAIDMTGRDDGLCSIESEPPGLRERYGQDRFGQSLLLARRLVERDVSFVGVHFNNMSKCDGWDTHKNNFKCLREELLPMLDRSLSALLEDLADRGLLDETLVVCMGEFGRTPKINKNAGRDHWGHCGSLVMAGGGVRGGNVVGASDKNGAYPITKPIAPPDLVASIYHALGLNPHQLVIDPRLNRTLQLSDGEVISALF